VPEPTKVDLLIAQRFALTEDIVASYAPMIADRLARRKLDN
jgi:hypothetical protein